MKKYSEKEIKDNKKKLIHRSHMKNEQKKQQVQTGLT